MQLKDDLEYDCVGFEAPWASRSSVFYYIAFLCFFILAIDSVSWRRG